MVVSNTETNDTQAVHDVAVAAIKDYVPEIIAGQTAQVSDDSKMETAGSCR